MTGMIAAWVQVGLQQCLEEACSSQCWMPVMAPMVAMLARLTLGAITIIRFPKGLAPLKPLLAISL